MTAMPYIDTDRRTIDPAYIPPYLPGYTWRSNDSTSASAAAAQERAERALNEGAVVRVESFTPRVPGAVAVWAVYTLNGSVR